MESRRCCPSGSSCSRCDDEATPFSSAEWARAWWTHWAGAGTPFIVTVRDSGRLVGLAPLVLARRGPFRVLTELGRPPSNYWDVLSEPARARGCRGARDAGGARPQRRVARAAAGRRADGLCDRTRRCCRAGCGCAGDTPPHTPASSCRPPSTSTSPDCRASAGRTCAGTCAASTTGDSSCATSPSPTT